MANSMVKWSFAAAKADYAALATKDPNTLYYIQDTKEIYRGAVSFTESVVIYEDELPAIGALGKLYVNKATLAGSVFNGTTWTEVVKAISDVVTTTEAPNGVAAPVSGKAVKAYVTSAIAGITDLIKGVTYDAATAKLTITKNDNSTVDVPLTKLATSMTYDGATGKLTLKDSAATTLSEINIPLDNFVESGAYNETNKALELTMTNGTVVSIPAADFFKMYTAEDTATVDATITTNAEGVAVIKADVKVSAEAGNGLEAKTDGLYAKATDISGKLDKVATDKADEIITALADGTVAASGKKAGAATIAATPDANTLATEAAVAAVRDALQTQIETGVGKDTVVKALNADAPSEEKITSEKAVVDAISWEIVTPAVTTKTVNIDTSGVKNATVTITKVTV